MNFENLNSKLKKFKLKMEETPALSIKVKYTLVNEETSETQLDVYNYTEKSFAISITEHFGKAFKDQFKEVGGRYNPSLSSVPHKGWVFSRNKYGSFQEMIDKIIKGEIKGAVPVIYTKKKAVEMKSDSALAMLPTIPPIVSGFKQFFEKANSCFGSEIQMHTEGANRYIWGPNSKVDNVAEELNLIPMMCFSNLSHKLIIGKI